MLLGMRTVLVEEGYCEGKFASSSIWKAYSASPQPLSEFTELKFTIGSVVVDLKLLGILIKSTGVDLSFGDS